MAAKSITEAKRLAKSFGNSLNHTANRCNNGILVGGSNSNGNAVFLTKEEKQLITSCMETSTPGHAVVRVEEIAFKFRSLFLPLKSIDGVLYRVDEDIIFLTSDNVEEVARVKAFLSVLVNGSYCTLAKIELYQKLEDEYMFDELRNDHNDVVELSNETAIITVTSISRKVMLYPHPVGSTETFAVVDFERSIMPISWADIVVPFYPMVNDIVVIRGENDEIWVARILRVNTEEKTVKVWYYREQSHEVFVPEASSREALDIVNWDSIVYLAPEEWIDVGS